MKNKLKKEQNKLAILENELIELISKTGDQKLMYKFLKWKHQRNVCNSIIIPFIDSILKL